MIILTLLLALIFTPGRGQADQSSCNQVQDGNNSSYVCKKLTECSAAKQLVPTGKAVVCGSGSGEPRICCPVVSLTPAEIAIQKCEEYSKTANLKKDCFNEEQSLAGGRRAAPKQFPYMAALGYNRYNDSFTHVEWLCSGSLISEQFVLIAAHCAKPKIYSSPKWVILGEVDLNVKNGATAQIYSVVEVFIYPNYTNTQYYHDIALLKLNSTVEFSPFIKPICLHTSSDAPSSEKVITMVGWEIAKTDGNDRRLLGTEASLMADSICDAIYGNLSLFKKGLDPKSMICAGVPANGKDLCAGSSGGPLQIPLRNTDCMWTEIGIISVGNACGKKLPLIYTRVAYYIDWIKSIVWP